MLPAPVLLSYSLVPNQTRSDTWNKSADCNHYHQETYPVLMAVSGEKDVVANVIAVQMLESPVSVGDIALIG